MWEVPHGAGSGNNKLGASNDEGIHPKKTEEMVNKYISGLFRPLHRGYELERRISWLDFSDWENVDSCEDPESNETGNDSKEDYWDEEDWRCSIDEVGSTFYDRNSKSDSVAETENN